MSVYYIQLEGKTNFSTMLFNRTYTNVARVDVCYAELSGEENKPIVVDVQELRTPFCEDGRDINEERTIPVSQGSFFTLPGREALRIFRENTDYAYGINYSPPISFNRLTTRILDINGKPINDARHVLVLRITSVADREVPPAPVFRQPPTRQQVQRQRPIYLVQN